MQTLTYIAADELRRRLPWRFVIDALETAAAQAFTTRALVDRTAITTEHGQFLMMPAVSADGVGIKLVGIGNENGRLGLPRIHALYVLFDAETLAPVAVLDGTTLTAIRTAGQSAMAVARISRVDARRLVIFGTGPQAEAHVHAIAAVRPIERVRIVGRRPEAVQELCRRIGAAGLSAEAASPDDVAGADIVVCATTSSVPIFDGALLPEQACVVAVGSHTPGARELDDETFRRARLVLVEDHATAQREAGDVITSLESGALQYDRIRDFGQLDDPAVAPGGIVVYKSVGMAYQDLALATAVLAERAKEQA